MTLNSDGLYKTKSLYLENDAETTIDVAGVVLKDYRNLYAFYDRHSVLLPYSSVPRTPICVRILKIDSQSYNKTSSALFFDSGCTKQLTPPPVSTEPGDARSVSCYDYYYVC